MILNVQSIPYSLDWLLSKYLISSLFEITIIFYSLNSSSFLILMQLIYIGYISTIFSELIFLKVFETSSIFKFLQLPNISVFNFFIISSDNKNSLLGNFF